MILALRMIQLIILFLPHYGYIDIHVGLCRHGSYPRLSPQGTHSLVLLQAAGAI